MTVLELRLAILAACVLCGQIGWSAARLAYQPKPERPELGPFETGPTWAFGTSSEPLVVQIFADQRPRPAAPRPIQADSARRPVQP